MGKGVQTWTSKPYFPYRSHAHAKGVGEMARIAQEKEKSLDALVTSRKISDAEIYLPLFLSRGSSSFHVPSAHRLTPTTTEEPPSFPTIAAILARTLRRYMKSLSSSHSTSSHAHSTAPLDLYLHSISERGAKDGNPRQEGTKESPSDVLREPVAVCPGQMGVGSSFTSFSVVEESLSTRNSRIDLLIASNYARKQTANALPRPP